MSTFIEREQNLIKKLQETDFELFDGDKNEAFDTIGDALNSFPEYCNRVITQQMQTPIIRARYEGQELRDAIMQMDSLRRSAHESAITNFNVLNRISKALDLEPFTTVDTKDRYAVQEEVGRYVSEIYKQGTGRTFDELTMQTDHTFETKNEKRIKQMHAQLGDITEKTNSDMQFE